MNISQSVTTPHSWKPINNSFHSDMLWKFSKSATASLHWLHFYTFWKTASQSLNTPALESPPIPESPISQNLVSFLTFFWLIYKYRPPLVSLMVKDVQYQFLPSCYSIHKRQIHFPTLLNPDWPCDLFLLISVWQKCQAYLEVWQLPLFFSKLIIMQKVQLVWDH